MNSVQILGKVLTSPALVTTKNEKTFFCTVEVQITPFKEDAAPWPLVVCGWGKTAEAMAADLKPDAYALLEADQGLQLEKGKPPELRLSRFFPLAPEYLPGPNRIQLVGRAGRDPEVRYFKSGSVVANFTIAVKRPVRDDDPDWFNLAIWGKTAEIAADYVRKGSQLGVIGSLDQEAWTDHTSGEERTKIVVKVDRLELLGSRRDQEQVDQDGWGRGPVSDEEVPF